MDHAFVLKGICTIKFAWKFPDHSFVGWIEAQFLEPPSSVVGSGPEVVTGAAVVTGAEDVAGAFVTPEQSGVLLKVMEATSGFLPL